jgi:hypothetical protein|tara:strand:- start:250 stop:513 length:264 start_codon:yes stop_codon:yes gene_type:complete
LSKTEPGLSANSHFFIPLSEQPVVHRLDGQALPVAGAHVRVESREFIKVDSPMPPEYGAGITPFSPLCFDQKIIKKIFLCVCSCIVI